MEITKEEREKLEQSKKLFNCDKLKTQQIEFILGREITVPPRETDEAVLRRQARLQRNKDPQRSLSSKTPRFKWGDIAKHAAFKGKRWQSKNTNHLPNEQTIQAQRTEL